MLTASCRGGALRLGEGGLARGHAAGRRSGRLGFKAQKPTKQTTRHPELSSCPFSLFLHGRGVWGPLRKDRPAIRVTVQAPGTLRHHVGSEGCRSKRSAFRRSHLPQVSPPSPASCLPPRGPGAEQRKTPPTERSPGNSGQCGRQGQERNSRSQDARLIQ